MNFANFWLSFLVACSALQGVLSMLPQQIRVAAIFDVNGDRKHELAFKYGVERVNREPNILPGKRLIPEIIRIPTGNRYEF